MSSKKIVALPLSWEFAQVAEVATLFRGVTYQKSEAMKNASNGYLPVLRATNITGVGLTFEQLVYVPQSCVSLDQMLATGDVVVASSSGSKDVVGKAGQLLGEKFVGSFGAFCTAIRPASSLKPAFLGYYFQSPNYRRAISDMAAGSNINNIKSSDLSGHLVPVAPCCEQVRIVAKLDELLSDLDAGIAELKAGQRKLALYRQSLLKAAVEGALTAPWRAAHAPTESGAQLLQRILAERRAHWEARQLAKFAQAGKTPPRGWQAKYPEPAASDLSDLPALPQGWVWANLDALIDEGPQNGLYLPRERYGSGTPMLRIDDYQIGWHRARSELNRASASADECMTYSLHVDDVVINRVNSMTHLGKSLLIGKELEDALFESNMMRFRLFEHVRVAFVVLYLGSDIGRARLTADAKWAVNQASINQQDVRATSIPFPPLEEQTEIVEQLTAALAAVKEQEAAIEKGLAQAAAQRRNILKAAFAGQLVAQDPRDEPASALLARIRAERAAQGAVHKKPRGRQAREAA